MLSLHAPQLPCSLRITGPLGEQGIGGVETDQLVVVLGQRSEAIEKLRECVSFELNLSQNVGPRHHQFGIVRIEKHQEIGYGATAPELVRKSAQ